MMLVMIIMEKRIASCSSDQKIKVWDIDESNNWTITYEIKGVHSGSIWKVIWAHPSFGQVLASCSFDRTVVIWEEEEDSQGKKVWVQKTIIGDSRESVSDIKFAPRHLGLKLATCSADGFVRIYEAIDVMNLSYWPLQEEFEAHKLSETQRGGVSISWNPSPYGPPSLVVGSSDPVAKIWEYNENYRRWQHVESLVGHKDGIHDVSWAPSMGRSYHLIATGSKDNTVRIWKLQMNNERHKPEASQLASFDDHKAEVWRVSWNITGTILASSGDDGSVRLWKASYQGAWRALSVVSGGDDEE